MVRRLLARLGIGGTPRGAALGRAGERLAARHLRKKGYRLLDRNAKIAQGEADLICLAPDERTIVFVEVKTRAIDPAQGPSIPPEANIHAHKRRKLVEVARALSARRGWTGRPLRIDVIAVEWRPAGDHVLRHHEHAVKA